MRLTFSALQSFADSLHAQANRPANPDTVMLEEYHRIMQGIALMMSGANPKSAKDALACYSQHEQELVQIVRQRIREGYYDFPGGTGKEPHD